MNSKKEREGKLRKSLQGLTTKAVKYINRDKVKVEILETKESVWTDWQTFNKGLVRGDITKLHAHTDCSLNQAKFYIISLTLLMALGLGALAFIFLL